MSAPRVILYADVNFGLIDGSSIWATSVADAFAAAGAHVTLLCKFPIRDYRVLAPLVDREDVRLVDPEVEGFVTRGKHLMARDAAKAIATLDEQLKPTAIVARGRNVGDALSQAKVGRGRLWCYLTDIPQAVTEVTSEPMKQLSRIASWAAKLLCQTEQLRGFLDQMVPSATGKTFVLPPIVPDQPSPQSRSEQGDTTLNLVYSGKFAARWRTLEMCAIPGDLLARGVDARLVMLGDKIHREPDMPDYFDRMTRALTESYGVEWLGGVTRSAALERVAASDVALAWRAPELDASLELSTKLLEFGACGTPALFNRTPMHEDLVGEDYPLFVDSYENVLDTLTELVLKPGAVTQAAERLSKAAARYRTTEAANLLHSLLVEERRATSAVGWPGGGNRTVLIAGHDLKFVDSIADALGRHGDTRVVFDKWNGHARHDAAASERLLRNADVILCEWMLGNAVWYSHNKRPGQRLVVRLHRVEVETDYPELANMDAIDAVIFVGEDLARQARAKFGMPKEKCFIIPNAIDSPGLRRPKERGHEYVLGMIGGVPIRKRLDLAIALLRQLRTVDKRFTLRVKGKAPWELPWVWKQPEEREYFERILRDLSEDPDLSDAVVFDKAGPDVSAWLRGVGWIVSTSDEESFHVSVAEGMGSGAVPLVRQWQGASEIYDARWLHNDTDSMAATVTSTLASCTYDELACVAIAEAARFDVAEVTAAFAAVLADRASGHSCP